MCCSVWQCVAVCGSVLQRVAVHWKCLPKIDTDTYMQLMDVTRLLEEKQEEVRGYVAVCCSVLQCVAVCCSVLKCVAMCCSVLA